MNHLKLKYTTGGHNNGKYIYDENEGATNAAEMIDWPVQHMTVQQGTNAYLEVIDQLI